MSIRDRVAIVTCGNRGLGRSICLMLAREGVRVVVASRTAVRNQKVAEEIDGLGAEALPIELDVSVPSSIVQMVDRVLSHWGKIDIPVNNAGINGKIDWIVNYDPDEWDRIFTVNLRGPFLCTKAVLPGMIARGKGKIVNVAAGVGDERVDLGGAAYYAAKAGLINFTRQLAAEGRPQGIVVHAFDPDGLSTEMTEEIKQAEKEDSVWTTTQVLDRSKGHRTPDEIMPMVRFLVSDDSNMMTGRFLQVSSRGSPLYLQL